MQAFQPRPLQGGSSGSGPSLPSMDSNKVKVIMKVIGVIVLVIIAIIIFSSGKTYSRVSKTAVDDRTVGSVITEEITVTSPTASERVRLPFYVTGTARSNWFTDGVFPVEVYDGKNTLLVSTFAIADIAPPDGGVATFRAVIEKLEVQPATRIGRIVLHRAEIHESPRAGDIESIGIDFTDIGLRAFNSSSDSQPATTDTKDTKPLSGVSAFSDTNTGTKSTGTTKPVKPAPRGVPGPAGPNTCNDGLDNDRDARLDSEDPDCHTDGYPTNNSSYEGARDENPVVAPPSDPATTPENPNPRGPIWQKQQWMPAEN